MSSSELSNALNPYLSQPRTRSQYHSPYPPVTQPHQFIIQPQPCVPHRSELELAFAEPSRVPPPQTQLPLPLPLPPPVNAEQPRLPTSTNVQAVHELLRVVTATRDSQETERKRRVAWEQEQEERYLQKQAEMQKMITEMRDEISILRSNAATQPATFTPQHLQNSHLLSPVSLVSQLHADHHSAFGHGTLAGVISGNYSRQSDGGRIHELTTPTVNTTADFHAPDIYPSQIRQPSSVPVHGVRGAMTQSSSDEEDEGSGSDNSPQMKRKNGHDKRVLTIHAALRKHLLHMMGLEYDEELPDSHIEGEPFDKKQPVRFVWEKTTRQSVHNTRMKARVLEHLKSNRFLYKTVPEKEFGKKVLEAAYESVYTTLRQKFKGQRDENLAIHQKRRENVKSLRARRISRKKIKLSNRSEARAKIDRLTHATFDGAMQLECMSSEESEQEDTSTSQFPGVLHTRGCGWRSSRLVRFYAVLDEEDKAADRPKRGVGRKQRCPGPVKDGFQLPPTGVATWMVSQRWIRNWQGQFPDLLEVLGKRINDTPGFDSGQLDELGEESDVEPAVPHAGNVPPMYTTHHSSSLDYALHHTTFT